MSQHILRLRTIWLLVVIAALWGSLLPNVAPTGKVRLVSAGTAGRPSIMTPAGQAAAQPARVPVANVPALAAAPSPKVALHSQVFGFVQGGNLSSPYVGWSTYQLSLLSTIAFFAAPVDYSSGHFVGTSAGWSEWASPSMTNLISAAHAVGTKVVLTAEFQSLTGTMCQALQHSNTTIADTVGQVVGRGIDGVNIDYEGASGGCGSSTNQALMTQFVTNMRAALPAADSLTVDTYGASAYFPSGDGFFDIAAMKPYVSAFFVMAYELDSGNFDQPPLNCPPPTSSNPETCMSPTSPLSAPYKWNDQDIAAQYSSVAGANKVILGLPYYGWASCTTNMNPNAPTYPVPGLPHLGWTANTQYGIQGLNFLHFQADVHDGVDQWAAYNSGNDPQDPCPPTYGGARELYIDSAASLSAKYQLALRDGLAGVGIWSLDMGGGLPYLWNAIDANFAETPLPPAQVTASPGDGFAYVSWPASAGPNPVNSYTITAAPGGRSVSVPAGSTSTTFTGLTDGTTYTFTVSGVNGYGSGLASQPSNAVIPTPFPGSYPGRYHPLTNPTRIFDSRSGLGQGGAGIKFGAGSVQTLSIPGIQGLVPSSGVSAVMLNVTIADATTPSYVTVSPDGTNPSAVSTINFGTSMSRANMIEVAVGANGKIQIYNSVGSVDVILDLMGWVGSSADLGAAGHFMPQTPAYRTLDTRPPQCTQAPGALCSPLSPGPGGVRTISVFGPGAPAPAQVEAAVLNVTAVGPSSAGYIQVWPAGQSQPLTSSVNFVSGQTVANRVVVPTGSAGQIEIFSSNASVNVLVDVVGWYTSAAASVAGGLYTATYPVRALDTRSLIGTSRVSPLGPNSWLSVSIAGILGIPASGVGEVAINVTVTDPTSYSFLQLNSSPTLTGTSDLNFVPGQTIANMDIVPVNPANGDISVYNSQGSADVIIDVYGWYHS